MSGHYTIGIGGQYCYPDDITVWPPNDNELAEGEYTGWQISDGGGWLPGIYGTHETALKAARTVDIARLQTLSDQICNYRLENRAITDADLEGP